VSPLVHIPALRMVAGPHAADSGPGAATNDADATPTSAVSGTSAGFGAAIGPKHCAFSRRPRLSEDDADALVEVARQTVAHVSQNHLLCFQCATALSVPYVKRSGVTADGRGTWDSTDARTLRVSVAAAEGGDPSGGFSEKRDANSDGGSARAAGTYGSPVCTDGTGSSRRHKQGG